MNERENDALVVTPGKPLRGEVGGETGAFLPGDKSLSHRSALLAALAEGESQVDHFLVAGVTQAMLDGLTALGVEWELQGRQLRVLGQGLERQAAGSQQPVFIHCGNSATTLRLLAGAVAAWGRPATLDGSPSLRRRPMRRIVEPLQQMGVAIQATDGCAPLQLAASKLPLAAMDYSLPVASAQVKSCLLLAALAAQGTTTLREPGPSRDHTERMLMGMGVAISSEQEAKEQGGTYTRQCITRLTVEHRPRLTPIRMTLPGDISAAAFLIVAALITPGSQITLRGVGLNPTRTGLLEALQSMGAEVSITNRAERHGEPVGDLSVCHSDLRATQVSGDLVVRMIDEFPAFAVAAAYARGTTVVGEAQELRHKESDRISALCQELRKLGANVNETADGFVIGGGKHLYGGRVNPHGDHRLAMALAVAGLAAQEMVVVEEADIIQESFPEFEATLRALGAEVGRGA
jgi:3-phosphoshikimate 1-carboxyvinyltransferase